MNAGLMLFAIMIVLALLGFPLFLSAGIATAVAMHFAGFPLEALVQKAFVGINNLSLLAIPLFILAGSLMAKGITGKLINISNAILGHLKGSLASVTVLASALFGAISGSALATVAAIGGATIPAMEKEGYEKAYAGAVASCSSVLGPLVPPSVVLIIYANITETSVTKLFSATILPAVITTIAFVGYTLYYGYKHDLPSQEKGSLRKLFAALKGGIWALLMPVLVLGCIFAGVCTVMEAAAISVLYALFVDMVIYKCLTREETFVILKDSAIASAAIMMIVALSKSASYVVVTSQLPQKLMQFMVSRTDNKILVLLFVNVVLLVLGCIMEGNAILVMMVPVLLTLVNAYQINLIQFGVMTALNIYVGGLTPPVGISLLMGVKMADEKIEYVIRESLPMFAICIVVLLMVAYLPALTLWLPSLLK